MHFKIHSRKVSNLDLAKINYNLANFYFFYLFFSGKQIFYNFWMKSGSVLPSVVESSENITHA